MVVKYTPPDLEDDNVVVVQEIDYATGYPRPRLQPNVDSDPEELSEDIRFRLWLARQLALLKAQGHQLKIRT